MAVTSIERVLLVRDEHFVRTAYRVVLGREPQGDDLWHHVRLLRKGLGRFDLIGALRTSSENANSQRAGAIDGSVDPAEHLLHDDEAFIVALYDILFKREPDPQGLADNLAALREGLSREDLYATFVNARESARAGITVGSAERRLLADDGPFVRAAYRALLGRAPEQAEFAAHVKDLRAGGSRWHLLDALTEGCLPDETSFESVPEQRVLADDGAFVAALYDVLLRRAPDDDGLAANIEMVRMHGRAFVHDAIATSAEGLKAAELASPVSAVPAMPIASPSPVISLFRPCPDRIFLLFSYADDIMPASVMVAGIVRGAIATHVPLSIVLWDREQHALVLAVRPDLEAMGLDDDIVAAGYVPIATGTMRSRLDCSALGKENWLLLAEPFRHGVTDDRPHAVLATLAARRLDLAIAHIFDGADALRSRTASPAAVEADQRNVQAMLMADVIITTSRLAEHEITALLTLDQLTDTGPLIGKVGLPVLVEDFRSDVDGWKNYVKGLRTLLRRSRSDVGPLSVVTLYRTKHAVPGDLVFADALARMLRERGVKVVDVTDEPRVAEQTEAGPPSDRTTGRWLFVAGLIDEPELLRVVGNFADPAVCLAYFPPPGSCHVGRDDREHVLLIKLLSRFQRVMLTSDAELNAVTRMLLASRDRILDAEHSLVVLPRPATDVARWSSADHPAGATDGEEEPFRRYAEHGAAADLWKRYSDDLFDAIASHLPSHSRRPIQAGSTPPLHELFPGLRPRPKLSICISTYQRAEWLRASLAIIFGQLGTGRPEVEVVVVDNASDDHTPQVCADYVQRDDFHYFRNIANVGMLGNLLVTSQRARGEYVWVMGDDDLLRHGTVDRVLRVLETHNSIRLIYLNYGYSSEGDPRNIVDWYRYLNKFGILEPSGPDELSTVAGLAAKSENFYTAIWSHIYRRDDAIRSYGQDTSGRVFSTMASCIPTSLYVLSQLADQPAYWIGEPVMVVNSNVSWTTYAPLFELEQFPRAWDMAEIGGCPRAEVDQRRADRLWMTALMWNNLFRDDAVGNSAYVDPVRVLNRIKHLPQIDKFISEMISTYTGAYLDRRPAASVPPRELFAAFLGGDVGQANAQLF